MSVAALYYLAEKPYLGAAQSHAQRSIRTLQFPQIKEICEKDTVILD